MDASTVLAYLPLSATCRPHPLAWKHTNTHQGPFVYTHRGVLTSCNTSWVPRLIPDLRDHCPFIHMPVTLVGMPLGCNRVSMETYFYPHLMRAASRFKQQLWWVFEGPNKGGRDARVKMNSGSIEGVNRKIRREQQQGVTGEQRRKCLQLLRAQAATMSIRLDAHITIHSCGDTTLLCCCGNAA